MALKEEDFPVYQQIVRLDAPGVNLAKSDFQKATDDEGKYAFALGIQTVATLPVGVIPGVTMEMKEATLRSCMAVFKDLSSKGHKDAEFMVRDFTARGLGG